MVLAALARQLQRQARRFPVISAGKIHTSIKYFHSKDSAFAHQTFPRLKFWAAPILSMLHTVVKQDCGAIAPPPNPPKAYFLESYMERIMSFSRLATWLELPRSESNTSRSSSTKDTRSATTTSSLSCTMLLKFSPKIPDSQCRVF